MHAVQLGVHRRVVAWCENSATAENGIVESADLRAKAMSCPPLPGNIIVHEKPKSRLKFNNTNRTWIAIAASPS